MRVLLLPGWPGCGMGIKWCAGGKCWDECWGTPPFAEGGIGRGGNCCALGGTGMPPPFGLKSLK